MRKMQQLGFPGSGSTRSNCPSCLAASWAVLVRGRETPQRSLRRRGEKCRYWRFGLTVSIYTESTITPTASLSSASTICLRRGSRSADVRSALQPSPAAWSETERVATRIDRSTECVRRVSSKITRQFSRGELTANEFSGNRGGGSFRSRRCCRPLLASLRTAICSQCRLVCWRSRGEGSLQQP